MFLIALICTARRRIPTSASANQGPGKGDLMSGGTFPLLLQKLHLHLQGYLAHTKLTPPPKDRPMALGIGLL